MGETKPQPLYKIELIGRKLLTGKTLTVKEKVWLANLLNATVSYRMADAAFDKHSFTVDDSDMPAFQVMLSNYQTAYSELDKYLLDEVKP